MFPVAVWYDEISRVWCPAEIRKGNAMEFQISSLNVPAGHRSVGLSFSDAPDQPYRFWNVSAAARYAAQRCDAMALPGGGYAVALYGTDGTRFEELGFDGGTALEAFDYGAGEMDAGAATGFEILDADGAVVISMTGAF